MKNVIRKSKETDSVVNKTIRQCSARPIENNAAVSEQQRSTSILHRSQQLSFQKQILTNDLRPHKFQLCQELQVADHSHCKLIMVFSTKHIGSWGSENPRSNEELAIYPQQHGLVWILEWWSVWKMIKEEQSMANNRNRYRE